MSGAVLMVVHAQVVHVPPYGMADREVGGIAGLGLVTRTCALLSAPSASPCSPRPAHCTLCARALLPYRERERQREQEETERKEREAQKALQRRMAYEEAQKREDQRIAEVGRAGRGREAGRVQSWLCQQQVWQSARLLSGAGGIPCLLWTGQFPSLLTCFTCFAHCCPPFLVPSE